MSGDVVLKLDADAARYVAEIVKAVEKTKGLGDGAKAARDHFASAGDLIEAGTAKLGRMVSGAGILAAASAVITAEYRAWRDHLEAAEKVSVSLADRLRGAAGSMAELSKIPGMTQRIMDMKSPLNQGQRASAALAARDANPNLSPDDLIGAVRSASVGHALNISPEEMGAGYGKLFKSFGSEAGDVAGLLHQRDTKNAPAAIDLLRQIGQDGGDAKSSLSLVSAAGRTEGGLGALTELQSKYRQYRVAESGGGTFDQWARKQSEFTVGEEHRQGFRDTLSQYSAEDKLIGRGSHAGYLIQQDRAIRQADPDTGMRLDTELHESNAEAEEYKRGASRNNELRNQQAIDKEEDARTGGVGIHARSERAFIQENEVNVATAPNAVLMIWKMIHGEIKTQTQQSKPKPAVGTQGEGGH